MLEVVAVEVEAFVVVVVEVVAFVVVVGFVEEEVHEEAEVAHPEVVAVVVALGVEGDFRICNISNAFLLFCCHFCMHRLRNNGKFSVSFNIDICLLME